MHQNEQPPASPARIARVLATIATRRHILGGGVAAAGGIVVGSLANPLTALAASDGQGSDDIILRFSTLAGVQPPFLGDAGLAQFRGVHGGPLPWVIAEGNGVLRADGRLSIRVRGLVLDPASVPAPNGGTNPIPSFMAIVSGFSTDPVNPVNLSTGLFPASKTGNADIAAHLALPQPFFAPIVFVTSVPFGSPAEPRWFAVTGSGR